MFDGVQPTSYCTAVYYCHFRTPYDPIGKQELYPLTCQYPINN
eukprot:SAG31_NODE_28296_length_412_cov_0.750799_1_plen_42_part_01